MEDHADTRKLIVALAKTHPIFFLEEQQRNEIIIEMLDHYPPSTNRMEKELSQLNAKVAALTAKMDLINDIFESVMSIRKTMEQSSEGRISNELIVKSQEQPLPAQESPQREENKQIKFDVDAFLDLG